MGPENRRFQPQLTKPKGFEPFVNPEGEQGSQLFVNEYGGNYAQNMELNRHAIEKTLRLAHLDGQIFLTSFSPSRNRSIDANPDGSVSSKKSVFWGEKIEKDEANPY